MTQKKVVIQASHLRIDDATTHRRGDVVHMPDDLIARLGNSVKPLSEVNRTGDGVPEAIQKKDAEIRALKARVNELELDVVALKDQIEQNATTPGDKPDPAKGRRKTAPPT